MDLSQQIEKELTFRTSRSSGSGGQNVNKVETRVEAMFNVLESRVLDETQQVRIRQRLKNRINSEGILIVSCSETRSQLRNRELASERLIALITIALAKKKIRKKTGIPTGVKKRRLEKKKQQSEKKTRRKFNPDQH